MTIANDRQSIEIDEVDVEKSCAADVERAHHENPNLNQRSKIDTGLGVRGARPVSNLSVNKHKEEEKAGTSPRASPRLNKKGVVGSRIDTGLRKRQTPATRKASNSGINVANQD
jgi:hypothetical protein